MKKKYILLSIFVLLLLSGCKGNYNIEIKNDLSVSETFTINGDERFSLVGYTPSSMFNTLTNTYSDYYNSSDFNLYELTSDNNKLKINFKKDYSSLGDYKNSFYITKLYSGGLEITSKDGITTLKSNGNMDNFWVLLPGDYEDSLFEEVKISIKLPFKVESSNADVIDKDKNIYTWIYDYQESDKTINIAFSPDKKFVSSKFVIIKNILIILGILAILGLASYYGYKYYKKKNKEINEI